MQRHYGVDVTDLWRGTLTLRRLGVLIKGLPVDSATAYALAGDGTEALSGWRFADVLLARIGDELALYRWQFEAVHRDPKKGAHRPRPLPVVPRLTSRAVDSGEARVIPIVSPHQLGVFVNDEEE